MSDVKAKNELTQESAIHPTPDSTLDGTLPVTKKIEEEDKKPSAEEKKQQKHMREKQRKKSLGELDRLFGELPKSPKSKKKKNRKKSM